MAKRDAIVKYGLIIKKLRKSPSSFIEIKEYLMNESFYHSQDFNISTRTFQRYINDIRTIYDIDIKFDFSRKVYFIEFDDNSEQSERLFDAFEILHTLNIAEDNSPYLIFTKRKPQGTENLSDILLAIKNKLKIEFNYQKYWQEIITRREAEPLLLKEFKYRWYLIAKDLKDNKIKSFGLDRLTNLVVTKKKFESDQAFKASEYYKNCFGIVSSGNRKLFNIILSFKPIQGKYIKSLPLHESQKILKDTNVELQVGLKLYLTNDFIMELLSYGDNVKVIQPKSLINQMKLIYNNALNLYND